MLGRETRQAQQAFAACQIKNIRTFPGRNHRTNLLCKGAGSGLSGESYISPGRAAASLARSAGKNACNSCIYSGKSPAEVDSLGEEQAMAATRRVQAETDLAEARLHHQQLLGEIAAAIGQMPEPPQPPSTSAIV